MLSHILVMIWLGELSLTGKVLPVGGIKEKVLAARRSGADTVILPTGCKGDFEELPQYVSRVLCLCDVVLIGLCCVVLCSFLSLPSIYYKYWRVIFHFILIVFLSYIVSIKLQVKDCVTVHFVSDYHQVYEIAFPPIETSEPTATIAPMFIDQTASLPFLSMENGVKSCN